MSHHRDGSAEENGDRGYRHSDAQVSDGVAAGPKHISSANSLNQDFVIWSIAGIVIIFLIAATIVSIVNRCSSNIPQTPESLTEVAETPASSPALAASDSQETWTVLLYLCGSDLESTSGLATKNLAELAQVEFGEGVTFVLETGGTQVWQNETVDPSYLTRYSISRQGFYEEEKVPLASMASGETLGEFISWGARNYPADHYMLVLWDHGGGSVYSVCRDEFFQDDLSALPDTLSLPEIRLALEMGGVSFDVIGFDACLMAAYETVITLAPYADCLVASEEIEPWGGWDYASWPKWLNDHKGATGIQLGAEICDSYYKKCSKQDVEDYATLSVVDLSKAGLLKQSFDGVSREHALAIGDYSKLRSMQNASSEVMRFGDSPKFNMIDLGDYMRKMRPVFSHYCDDVITSIEQAVVYQVRGEGRQNAAGLSVYYPLDTSNKPEYSRYLEVMGDSDYAKYIAWKFNSGSVMNSSSESPSDESVDGAIARGDVIVSHTAHINAEGNLELSITDGINNLASVSIEILQYLPESESIVHVENSYSVSSDWQRGIFTDKADDGLISFNDCVISSNRLESSDEYSLYDVPVLRNGGRFNMIIRHDNESGRYGVLCVVPVGERRDQAPKEMWGPDVGDKIEFQFVGYSLDGEQVMLSLDEAIEWDGDYQIEEVPLPDGVYLRRFVLTDVLGQSHMTDMFAQVVQDGSSTLIPFADYLQSVDGGKRVSQ